MGVDHPAKIPGGETKLNPLGYLSQYFSGPMADQTVHLVVYAPSLGRYRLYASLFHWEEA